MTAFILSGDCGGTKSTFVTLDEETGSLRKTVTLGPANVIADPVGSIEVIKSGVLRLLAEENQPCAGIVLGIAGLATAGIQEALSRELAVVDGPIYLIDDALLALYGKLAGKDGVLLIAGTGSIAYARYQGSFTRAGGFGHLLGDEGSGYWIGKQGFLQVCKAADSPHKFFGLANELMVKENSADPYEVIRKFYTLSKAEIAAYAPLVANSATAEAEAILRQAAEYLAQLVLNLQEKAGLPEGLPLVFSGSVLTKNPVVRQRVAELLGTTFDTLPVTEEGILQGAFHYFNEQKLKKTDSGKKNLE